MVQVMKKHHFSRALAFEVGFTCSEDKDALAMAEYICDHPNEEEEMYVDKAYEIIGEERPKIIIED